MFWMGGTSPEDDAPFSRPQRQPERADGRCEIERSILVKFWHIAVVAGSLFVGGAAAQASPATGTWLATYTVSGNTVDRIFVQWHKDGTTVQSNSHAPNNGNLLLGEWQADGKTVSANLSGWRYDNGTLTGTFVKTETDTFKKHGYAGDFDLKFYDLDGNLVNEVQGQVAGTRLSP